MKALTGSAPVFLWVLVNSEAHNVRLAAFGLDTGMKLEYPEIIMHIVTYFILDLRKCPYMWFQVQVLVQKDSASCLVII